MPIGYSCCNLENYLLVLQNVSPKGESSSVRILSLLQTADKRYTIVISDKGIEMLVTHARFLAQNRLSLWNPIRVLLYWDDFCS
jgi:hypothetical protein